MSSVAPAAPRFSNSATTPALSFKSFWTVRAHCPTVDLAVKVSVHLLSQSKPVELTDVRNCYQKGDLYCVMLDGGEVHKFPIAHIFRVIESDPPPPVYHSLKNPIAADADDEYSRSSR